MNYKQNKARILLNLFLQKYCLCLLKIMVSLISYTNFTCCKADYFEEAAVGRTDSYIQC